jgi:hypothetical protein
MKNPNYCKPRWTKPKMLQMEKATCKPALTNFTTENPSSDDDDEEEEEEEDVQMSVDGDGDNITISDHPNQGITP